MEPRNLPVGIQDFEKLRKNGCVYIDKTEYIYSLAGRTSPYFLSRPRRFGKSLFLSTLEAYFQGKKELFEGLAIAGMEKNWEAYPVLHIDMNNGDYTTVKRAESCMGSTLRMLERDCGIVKDDENVTKRFESLIRRVYEKTGKPVVVLIDEYDKPLLIKIEEGEINPGILAFFKRFYGTLKSMDKYLRFVFFTGVTKFSHVSVFSDLNQLTDISLVDEYAAVCGITEAEMLASFKEEFAALAEKNHITVDEAIAITRRRYNGYHFSKNGEAVYNPFSVLKTLMFREFGDYWFSSGTPTFLIKLIQKQRFEIPEFRSGIAATEQALTDYRVSQMNLIPLLYQSGYLTLKKYNEVTKKYTLGFPNEEVEDAFLRELLQGLYEIPLDVKGLWVDNFADDLRKGDIEGFMKRMEALLEDMPYPEFGRPPKGVKKADFVNAIVEQNVQHIFYLVFTLMGKYVQAEVHNAQGRADAVAVSGGTAYIFEFKIAKKPEEAAAALEDAFAQIDERRYNGPYKASGLRILKIGAVYELSKRRLAEWKAVEAVKDDGQNQCQEEKVCQSAQ